MEDFSRILRLPPYVVEKINQARAAARNAGADIIDMDMRNPCLPTPPHVLEKLQETLGGKDFEVVAINIDTRDPEKPKNFLKEAGLTKLAYFHDQKAKVFQELKSAGRALGMPTSVLVDGAGCEIATIAGTAEWASDDAMKLIKAATGLNQ